MVSPPRLPSVALVLALFALALPGIASACPSCSSGDPTLSTFGTELPSAGRTRLGFEARFHNDGSTDAHVETLREYRLGLSLAWFPTQWLALSGAVPAVLQDVTSAGRRAWTPDFGNVELRARAFVFRDRPFRPRHLVAVTASAGVGGGNTFSGVDEPGTSHGGHSHKVSGPAAAAGLTWETGLGLSYSHFSGGPWSAHASLTGLLPLTRSPLGAGRTLQLAAVGQYQWLPALAVRAGIDGRHQSAVEADPRSGSALTYATADLLYMPASALTLVAGVKVPVWAALQPGRWEGPFASLGAVVEL